jgi:hypothetical protein
MDRGRGPVNELEERSRKVNLVSDPMDEGRGPVKELE